MTIGILYESNEWSDFALRDHIASMGAPVKMFDLMKDPDTEELLSCALIVNRVFASAVFRGHEKALEKMPAVIELLGERCVRMINPAEAHYYEISKTRSKKSLIANGFPVPKLYDILSPLEEPVIATASEARREAIQYPCVVKPDCGGRTNYTFIINSREEIGECMSGAPKIDFIAEEYICPEYGFVTRVEIIDGDLRLSVKRSVTEGGLSAYHLGSEYEIYTDLSDDIKNTAVKAMDRLCIEAGSMDIIENESGFYIIDVNAVSNVSEDNTDMFKFDLMKETAAYAVKIYGNL